MTAPDAEKYTGFIPAPFSRGEAVLGLVWLSMGMILALVLEVVYLNARIPLPAGGSVLFPVTILLAWWWNKATSATALLWDRRPAIAAIPLAVWLLGYVLIAAVLPAGGLQLMSNSILVLALGFSGFLGGVWPIVYSKWNTEKAPDLKNS